MSIDHKTIQTPETFSHIPQASMVLPAFVRAVVLWRKVGPAQTHTAPGCNTHSAVCSLALLAADRADSSLFIGSANADKTVTELIVRHNGIESIMGGGSYGVPDDEQRPDRGTALYANFARQNNISGKPLIPPAGFNQNKHRGDPDEGAGKGAAFAIFLPH